MACKALPYRLVHVKCQSSLHATCEVRVDGRESPGDILHDGYEELLKGACGLDPQLERERKT